MSDERQREKEWDEFNNSQVYIKEQLKKMSYRKDPTKSMISVDSLGTSEEIAMMAAQSSFASSCTDLSSGDLVKDFNLTLRVQYITKFGQSIGVIGSIP